MKRDRFSTDYDKVRERAGWNRPQYDFPDDAERRRVASRVAELNDDFKKRMAEISKVDEVRIAEIAKRQAETSAAVNRRMMIREWMAAGLEPPEPLYSLSLAFSLGCTIEEIAGKATLMIPSRVLKQFKKEPDIPF